MNNNVLKKPARLPKTQRLSTKCEFKTILAQGQHFLMNGLKIYFSPNTLSFSRIGFSISRTKAPAVLRNRVRRVLKEIFRTRRCADYSGMDFLVIVVKKINKDDIVSIKEAFIQGLKESALSVQKNDKRKCIG